MKKILLSFSLLLFLLTSCGKKEKIIFYCDAVMENWAKEKITAYQANNKNTEIELKVYSSEFIFQSLKLGAPADLVLAFDHSLAKEIKWKEKKPIRSDKLVFLEKKLKKSESDSSRRACWAYPPSGSPLAIWVEDWMKTDTFPKMDCKAIPNDPHLSTRYFSSSLVEGGFLFQSQVKEGLYSEFNTRVSPTGPEWQVLFPENATNPSSAKTLFDFLNSSKP